MFTHKLHNETRCSLIVVIKSIDCRHLYRPGCIILPQVRKIPCRQAVCLSIDRVVYPAAGQHDTIARDMAREKESRPIVNPNDMTGGVP
jgi:hypothetical protein